MTGVAAFDLDHTLVAGNVSYHFGKFLFRQGFLTTKKALLLICYYIHHKVFHSSLKRLHTKCFSVLFVSKKREEFKTLVQAFLTLQLESLTNTKVLSRLHQAKERGDHVVILSNSPDFLVEAIANYFNVPFFQGTEYCVDEKGCFSCINTIISGSEKAAYLTGLYHQGYLEKDTVAYSDSMLDLSFLERAGVAVAVNPERKLYRESLKRGWEILS